MASCRINSEFSRAGQAADIGRPRRLARRPRRAPRRAGEHGDGDEGGAILVELALLLPLCLLLVFGIIEFGFAFNANLELRSASREGARLAVVDNGCANSTTCGSADVQRNLLIATTRSRATGLANSSTIKVSVSYAGTKVGTDTVTVCLNYQLRPVTGIFAPVLRNVVLKSRAVMRLEQAPTFSPGTDTGGPGAATC